jgi:hypothetical protein
MKKQMPTWKKVLLHNELLDTNTLKLILHKFRINYRYILNVIKEDNIYIICTSQGNIEYDGRSINSLKKIDRNVGYSVGNNESGHCLYPRSQ